MSSSWITFIVAIITTVLHVVHSSSTINSIAGRHSFSLTTFDTQGHLQQVQYAIRASSQGIPVLCMMCNTDNDNKNDDDKNGSDNDDVEFVFVTPHAHALPSPLLRDVGTRRIARITPHIVISYSGIGADGRVLLSEAQRLAVEHAYTFDEDISIEQFINQMALFYQKYTMKAGVRPFGCALLVAYCDKLRNIEGIYKLDPAGAVEVVENGGIGFIGKMCAQCRNECNPERKSPEENSFDLPYSNFEKVFNKSQMNSKKVIDKLVSILKADARENDPKCNEKYMSFLVGTVNSKGDLKLEVTR